MKKMLIALLLMLCLSGAASAEEGEVFTEGAFAYVLTEDGAVITEYLFTERWPEVIEIPAELGGQPVVGLAEGAFTICTAEIAFAAELPRYTYADGFLIDTQTDTLLYTAPSSRGKPLPAVRRLGDWSLISWAEWDMHAVIPEGVEEIGAAAFYDVGVASLQLPESLNIIQTNAFFAFDVESGEVILPAGVEIVQFGAFDMGCVDSDPAGRKYWHLTITPADSWNTRFETYFEYAKRTGDDFDMASYTLALYDFELTDEGAVITDCDWDAYGSALPEVVTIPARIDEAPVVGVAENTLNTSMAMNIDHGFTLVIPEGVQWLSEDAFWCCHDAEAIHFPASLTEIPEGCFDHVWAEITVADGNPRYAVQDGFLIDLDTSTLLYVNPSSAGKPLPAVRRLGSGCADTWVTAWEQDLVIPEGVEEIGSYAFYDWEFGHVTLPETLRLIESMAFDVGITTPVIVPAGVELVEYWAFSGCGSVIEVIAASDATHFETAAEYEARTGETHWLDDWADEE